MIVAPPKLLQAPADPHNYGSRRGSLIEKVVLHTLEGHPLPSIDIFRDPNGGVSAHYVVGARGDLWQCVGEDYAAYHAGNADWNRASIGIELEGFAAKAESFTEPLRRALVVLLHDILARHCLSIDRTTIVGHCDVPDPRNPDLKGGLHHHTDPGAFFPWADILGRLAALLP